MSNDIIDIDAVDNALCVDARDDGAIYANSIGTFTLYFRNDAIEFYHGQYNTLKGARIALARREREIHGTVESTTSYR